VPGLGDEVQAIKAGILEIADVLAVNKADREGADRTVRDLLTMLELRHAEEPLGPESPSSEVEIIRTVAVRGEGIGELATAIQRHQEKTAHLAPIRRARRARRELRDALLDRCAQLVDQVLSEHAQWVDQVQRREIDPYSVSDRLLKELLRGATSESAPCPRSA
jgi:LAO/AO transport system kinase